MTWFPGIRHRERGLPGPRLTGQLARRLLQRSKRAAGNTGRRADEVIMMMKLWRTLSRLYAEQAYAWERLFRVGLPDPAQAREAASFRRWERELARGNNRTSA
jgi:hypothetical protein